MRPHRHKKSWHILRLPLSLVRRCELINASETKTCGQTSGNEITFTTETNSQYSVRLHYLTEAGEPGIDMLDFANDEALAQKWLTALGG